MDELEKLRAEVSALRTDIAALHKQATEHAAAFTLFVKGQDIQTKGSITLLQNILTALQRKP